MKKAIAIVSVILCVAMILSFGACTIMSGGKTTWDFNSDTFDGSVELLKNFFEGTDKSENLVVTITNAGKVTIVENIVGTSDHANYPTLSTDVYTFVKEGVYYMATKAPAGSYYITGKDNYDTNYRFYQLYSSFGESTGDDLTGSTFSCSVVGEGMVNDKGEESDSTSTLTFEGKRAGDEVKITGTAKDGLVRTINYSMKGTDEEGKPMNLEITITFTYGDAVVELPDISTWTSLSDEVYEP